MRYSDNSTDEEGFVVNGFDYDLQVWIEDYNILATNTSLKRGIAYKDIRDVRAEQHSII